MLTKARIAVLVSGGGTNLQALLDAERNGALPHGEIVLVVASKPGVYALERAKLAGVDGHVVSRKESGSQVAFEAGISALLDEYDVWYAEYGAGEIPPDAAMVQYTNAGSLPGVKGTLDLNHCYRQFQNINQ